MVETMKTGVLGEARNGIETPLYFDRQVVRASDLTLDRDSHDQELARMRRLLHGWGIVAGLDVLLDGDKLSVGRGYGITPTGAELYLDARLDVGDLAALIWSCCGPGARDCTAIDEDEIRRLATKIEVPSASAWLVARPTRHLGEPRAGVAAGCQHPANNAQLPTRACEGVQLELLCSLAPPHILEPASCSDLSQLVCQQSGQGFLTMPEAYDEPLSYLVLARLTSHFINGGRTVALELVNRKTLLPLAVLQQLLQVCLCPVLNPNLPGEGV